MDDLAPNKATAPNAAMTLWFQIEHNWRGIASLENMNKYRNAGIGLGLLALVGLWIAFHASAQTKSEQASPAAQADQQYQRMLDEQADRAKRAEVILKEQEVQHKRVETLLTKQEQLFESQVIDLKRYEKILEKWESQQQQYQKYLDTLPKK